MCLKPASTCISCIRTAASLDRWSTGARARVSNVELPEYQCRLAWSSKTSYLHGAKETVMMTSNEVIICNMHSRGGLRRCSHMARAEW